MQAKWGSTWQGTSWASLVSVSYLSGFLPLGTSLKWKGRASNQNLSKTFSLLIIVLWKSHLLKWPSFEDTEAVSKSHFRELVFRLTIKEFTLSTFVPVSKSCMLQNRWVCHLSLSPAARLEHQCLLLMDGQPPSTSTAARTRQEPRLCGAA